MSGAGVSAVTEIDQVLLACSPHSPGDGIRGAQPLSGLVQFHSGVGSCMSRMEPAQRRSEDTGRGTSTSRSRGRCGPSMMGRRDEASVSGV